MKKINVLGKRLYVLTDKEIRDPNDCPLYCIDRDAYCKIREALRQYVVSIKFGTMPDCEKTRMLNLCMEAYRGLFNGRSVLRL
mgnify:FL=1|jgi:hypothetical protein|nr:MAG TPA: hypothetical protein [Caudoviricetes sp.]